MRARRSHGNAPCGWPVCLANRAGTFACTLTPADSGCSSLLRLLKAREKELKGTVKLIFQPAEEGGAGGLAMVQAGVLESHPRIERVFALHVWPYLPSGVVATRSGTMLAAAGFFHATMSGKGGHAAMPHMTIDPFMCVATALSGLQTIVSRNLSPVESGVVSVTLVRGGSAYNVIPESAEIGGTLRSLSKPGYRYIDERTRDVLSGAAATHGCTLNLTKTEFEPSCLTARVVEGMTGGCTFPPTVNAPSAHLIAKQAATELVGASRVRVAEPTLGGEDFAYFLEQRPGASTRVRARTLSMWALFDLACVLCAAFRSGILGNWQRHSKVGCQSALASLPDGRVAVRSWRGLARRDGASLAREARCSRRGPAVHSDGRGTGGGECCRACPMRAGRPSSGRLRRSHVAGCSLCPTCENAERFPLSSAQRRGA